MTPRHALAAFSCFTILTASAASAQTQVAPAAGAEKPRPTIDLVGAEKSRPAIEAVGAETLRPAIEALASVPVTDTVPVVIADEDDPAAAASAAVDIPLNGRVQAFVDEFTTKRKRFLEDALSRGSRYLPMIQAIFREEGLPDDLVYLPLIESAFRSNAVSHAGATGIWQLMRTTATINGLSRDWYVDERLDPEKSTRAAAKLLKTLYGMFGDWNLSLAAYNAGAGRVQKAMKRSDQDSFWAIVDAGRKYLPKETQAYVPLFLASLVIARDPVAYGFNVSALAVESPLYDVVTLTRPLDLRRVAEWLGTTVDTLKELNPELRRWTTPARAAEYLLRVPAGFGAILEERLALGTPFDLGQHTVKNGETLLGIARKLKVTRADLAEANYLPITAKLKAGDKLIVPRAPEALRPMAATTLASAKPAGGGGSLDAPGLSKLVHLVRPGDTLDSIARAYRTTTTSLKEWNSLGGSRVVPGQELTIFSSSAW